MELLELQIQNFMAVGEAQLRLNNQGLVAIQGENLDDSAADSNGTGKSTIAEALCWVCYGVTARKVAADRVVNRTAKRDCKVSLRFRDGERVYEITRYRKHTEGKNSVTITETTNDESRDLTLSTEDATQTLIEKIIGCSPVVFRAAVYSAQEQLPDLPGSTDKVLKVLVEEAAGIDQLEACYRRTLKNYNAAQAELQTAVSKLYAERAALDLSVQALADARALHDEWIETQAQQVEELEGKLADLVIKRSDAEAAYEKNVSQIETQLAENKKRLAAAKALKADYEKQSLVVAELMPAYSRAGTMSHLADEDYKKQLKHLNALEQKVGTACGECGRLYTAADIETAKEQATNVLNKLKERQFQHDLDLQSATERLNAAKKNLPEVPDIDALETERDNLREARQESGDLKELITSATVQQEQLEKRIAELQSGKNPHAGTVATTDNQRKKAEAAVAERVVIEKTLAARAALLGQASEVFSPAGVRAHILDTITPFLNQRTAAYLGALSDGKFTATWSTLTRNAKGELKEQFSIEITNNKEDASFAELSGGEKRKIRLACALALQDLIASRATKAIGLWIGDEIDDALDNAGLERLMGILEDKARERGTVIVISHRDLADWIRQEIRVVRKDGKAFIN